MILAARRLEQLKQVAEECAAAHKESGVQAGGKFVPVQLDVADKAQVASLLDRIPEELRQVDVLGTPPSLYLCTEYRLTVTFPVNNAGFVLGVERVGDISDADYESMFQVNVFGLIAVTQLFVKGQSVLTHRFLHLRTRDEYYRLQKAQHRACYQPRLDRRPRALRRRRDLLCDEARCALVHRHAYA